MSSDSPRKPTAFRLDREDTVLSRAGEASSGSGAVVVEETDFDPSAPIPAPGPLPIRRGIAWGRIFWGALGALLSLGIGLAADRLVRDLFARNDLLGTLGLALAATAGVAAVAIVLREAIGLWRVARIDRLRAEAETAALADDADAARAVARGLLAIYRDRPDMARGRAALAGHLDQIVDGRDLLVLAEADLMRPLDLAASGLVADAARRVSVVTAVSPRAIVDVLFVLVAVLGLIRKLATLYGGRPGLVGFLRLARQTIAHLAVTGGMAAGDSLIQQIVGQGVAARLSARLGEGVVNGLLTARVGLAAIDVCRPLPFLDAPRPGVGDVMGGVVSFGETPERSR